MNKENAMYFYDNHSQFSVATTRTYLTLHQFFSFCAKSLDQIEEPDIQAWLHSLEERGLQPHSVRTQLAAIQSFYRYCMEENKLKRNPSLSFKLDKIEECKPELLSQQEISLLQEVTSTDARSRALIEMLCSTGVRVGELLNLKLDDVNWEDRQVCIRGKRNRHVHFSHECFTLLNAYLNERVCESEYLFCKNNGDKLDHSWLQLLFRKFSNEMGGKVSPHALRHSAATHFQKIPYGIVHEGPPL